MFETPDLTRAASLYRALSHPLRLEILLQLDEGPACVHDLVDRTGASQPLISQHLRVLRHEDLVAGRKSGKETVYQLADEHVAHILRDGFRHIDERK